MSTNQEQDVRSVDDWPIRAIEPGDYQRVYATLSALTRERFGDGDLAALCEELREIYLGWGFDAGVCRVDLAKLNGAEAAEGELRFALGVLASLTEGESTILDGPFPASVARGEC